MAVARSGHFTSAQVAGQAAIVWLLPVVGAAIVGAFLRSQRYMPGRLGAAETSMEVAGADGHLGEGGSHAP